MTVQRMPAWETWFRRVRPSAAPRWRLFCFGHAGASASFFWPWSKDIPFDVELYAVQYPGRADRLLEPCIEEIDVIADRIADALPPALDRPLALFGHSLGAAVAYEVARRLDRALSRPDMHLFVSGRPAPQLDRGGTVHLGSDAALCDDLRRLGGTSPEILDNAELRALVLRVLRSDYRLSETYRAKPGAALSCPVTAFIGDRDPELGLEEALGWRAVTRATFQSHVLAGDHFYLVPERSRLVRTLVGEFEKRRPHQQRSISGGMT
jgi:pyochelin biosynthetic protein PchC